MKINCCIAAAILAYCAAAAAAASPNPTSTMTSASLPSEPVSLFVFPDGAIKSKTPGSSNTASKNPGNLEDFPTIREDFSLNHHKNGTHRSGYRPGYRPGGHGPVVHPHHGKDHKNETLSKEHHLDARALDHKHGKNSTINHYRPIFRPMGHGGYGPVMLPPHPVAKHNASHGMHSHPAAKHNTTIGKQSHHGAKHNFTLGMHSHPVAKHNTTLEKQHAHIENWKNKIISDFKKGNLSVVEMLKALHVLHGSQPANITSPATLNTTSAAPQTEDEAIMSYFISSSEDAQPGNCSMRKAIEARKIIHNHDQDHTIVDDCKITSAEKTSKEASSIISKTKTEITNVHSDKTSNKHKTLADASDEINGMVDLPPQLVDYYLDQLAKMNASNANTFNNTTGGKTTLKTYTKTDPKEGTGSSDTNYRSINVTSVNRHEELEMDGHVPISVNSKAYNETPALSSSSLLSSIEHSSVATSLDVKLTPTVHSSIEPAITHEASTTSFSKSSISLEHSSTPSPTTFSSVTTSTPDATAEANKKLASVLASRLRAISVHTTTDSPKETTQPSTSTSEQENDNQPTATSTNEEETPIQTPKPSTDAKKKLASLLRPKFGGQTSTDSASAKKTTSPEETSNGGETTQPERRGQKAYINEVARLSKVHMDATSACKSNVTCVAESNQNYALALSEVKYH
ncbi:uncharacterized protein LY89DRAFT_678752 [Mollisia scopiformis]|uniref:Uncharacterized protein n=1 Tax=Mollisia scopiformis TaxID=149040 RepID=A0A132B493_MOLSC|nr:uncharacterized protein LY89DRAFT_678752 [Mollisia scopiformis]KUJ06487.1 hypothetical protein LY89DRAFT_678752 [Mollisia scopiformis]